MSDTKTITLTTVTYDREYPLLLTQARSIVKYMRPDFVKEIVWIVNHADGERQINQEFFQLSSAHLVGNGFSLRIVPRSAFGLEEHISRTIGWRHQQLLKLMVAELISTSHYLVLDTKNFFTRSVDHDRLFRNGKAISFRYNCPPLLERCLEASAKAMKCAIEGTQGVMPTATPYIMLTSQVRKMLQAKESSFVDFFYSDSSITEFFLYYCYLKNKGCIEEFYEFVPQFYATFFASYPSEPQQIEAVQRYVESTNVFCASFHNKRFVNCPPAFRDYVHDLWSRHGLITGQGDFESIFAAMSTAAA